MAWRRYCRHDGWCIPFANAAGVFQEHHVKSLVKPIFHPPVSPHGVRETLPIGQDRVHKNALNLKAAPAAHDLLTAVEVLKRMNACQARKMPHDAPTSFVRQRWEKFVRVEDGLDKRFYELYVLSELKNALRSGDI